MNSTSPPLRTATTRELARSGVDGRMLNRQVAQQRLTRVSRGIYLEAGPDSKTTTSPDSAPREHVRRAVACARAMPGSFLVAESACLAHGLPVRQIPPRLQLARHPRLQSVRPEVDARRAWWPHVRLVGEWDVAAQPPEAAVVEVAARRGTLSGLISADAVDHRGHTWNAAELLDAWGTRAGVARARLMLDLVDGRRESPLET